MRCRRFEPVDRLSHESDVDLTGGGGFPDGTVGEVRPLLQGPDAADFSGFAHPERGDELEPFRFFRELVQPRAVVVGVAHGGDFYPVRLDPFDVGEVVLEFEVARDAGEVVLGNEDLYALRGGEFADFTVIVQAVAFEVDPLRYFCCFEDFFPQGGAFDGSGVSEGTAVALETDGAQLYRIRGDLADAR